MVENRHELSQQSLLNQAITTLENPHLLSSAFGLVNFDGAYILAAVFAGQQSILEDRPILFHLPLTLLHAIGTRIADREGIRTLVRAPNIGSATWFDYRQI